MNDKKIKSINGAKEAPKENLLGFDRVAQDMRQKVEKLAQKKGISSINILAKTENGKPKFSGGMVGDVTVILEAVYYMAKQREDFRSLLEIAVKALKANDLQKVVKLGIFVEEGFLSAMCVNALEREGIYSLEQLRRQKKSYISNIKNIGYKSVLALESLMEERGWNFLTE